MWVFLNDAMVSAVEHRDDPRILVVRARLKGDLRRFFGNNIIVSETLDADYRYRTFVSRKVFTNALTRAVTKIDYTNFKNSVVNNPRHDAYMSVWGAMHAAQLREMPKRVYHALKATPMRALPRSWSSLFQRSLDSFDD